MEYHFQAMIPYIESNCKEMIENSKERISILEGLVDQKASLPFIEKNIQELKNLIEIKNNTQIKQLDNQIQLFRDIQEHQINTFKEKQENELINASNQINNLKEKIDNLYHDSYFIKLEEKISQMEKDFKNNIILSNKIIQEMEEDEEAKAVEEKKENHNEPLKIVS